MGLAKLPSWNFHHQNRVQQIHRPRLSAGQHLHPHPRVAGFQGHTWAPRRTLASRRRRRVLRLELQPNSNPPLRLNEPPPTHSVQYLATPDSLTLIQASKWVLECLKPCLLRKVISRHSRHPRSEKAQGQTSPGSASRLIPSLFLASLYLVRLCSVNRLTMVLGSANLRM